MSFPPPPNAKPDVKPSGKLTEDETTFILRTNLHPEHYCDPFVIRFISAYMRCRDTRQASQEAGMAANAGSNLLRREDIYRAVCALSEKSAQKYGFDASEVIERVKEVSSVDPIEFVNPDGTCKALHEIRPEARRAIKKFKARNEYGKDPNGMQVVTGQIIEIELWDKMKAHELLGREVDVFKETKRVEHDVTGNMASVLLGAAERGQQRLLSAQEPIDVTPSKEGEDA